MLQLQLYSILDTKAEAFFPPFPAANAAEALRSFSDLLVDPQSKIGKHPEDYRLYHVGEFHVVNGTVTGHPAGHVLVEDGLKLVKEA